MDVRGLGRPETTARRSIPVCRDQRSTDTSGAPVGNGPSRGSLELYNVRSILPPYSPINQGNNAAAPPSSTPPSHAGIQIGNNTNHGSLELYTAALRSYTNHGTASPSSTTHVLKLRDNPRHPVPNSFFRTFVDR